MDGPVGSGAEAKGRKRARVSGMYQRKRAVTACLPCRNRKTKCDNIRPVCGFCTKHEAVCTYPDAASDYSSFDPASLAILERINHVASLIESQSSNSPLSAHHTLPHGLSPDDQNAFHRFQLNEDSCIETPGFPAIRSNCESVLKWPIFQGFAPESESFVLGSSEGPSLPVSAHTPGLGRGIREEDFIPLSQRFLLYVHVKNPILDVPEFTYLVKDVADTGLRWDGSTCLILLACALGCISEPFEHGVTPQSSNSSNVHFTKEVASAYYLAAKKRLGLIPPSLLSIQCLFLCGIFEMYHLDALKAWHCFNQACVQLRNLFWGQGYIGSSFEQYISQEPGRLEQRLYWSCMKSECELRCEISLPSSGITRSGFPDILPSPPHQLLSSTTDSPEDPTNLMGQEEERSWFYYLAEISFRRIMNRAYVVMGGKQDSDWINNIQHFFSHHKTLEEQIDFWCSHIPPKINFNQSEGLNSELAYLVQARGMAYREWIHRPFLYYAIHQPADDPFTPQVMLLARKCLDLCVQLQLNTRSDYLHHGTWYQARSSATRALLLMAAFRSGKFEMPLDWKHTVQLASNCLQHWALESPDIKKAGDIVQRLFDMV